MVSDALNSMNSTKAVVGEVKSVVTGTFKWGRAALIVCGIFFTVDFVLKSTASICKSSLEIQNHYRAFRESNRERALGSGVK